MLTPTRWRPPPLWDHPALKVPAKRLLRVEPPKGKAVRGPTGKVRSTIEQVEKLPKRERARILDVANALIAQATAH